MAQRSTQQPAQRPSRAWMVTKSWILVAVVVTVFGAIHRNMKPGIVLFALSPFSLLGDMLWHRLKTLSQLPPAGRSAKD